MADVTIEQVRAFLARKMQSSYDDWCEPRGIDAASLRAAVSDYRRLYGAKSRRKHVSEAAVKRENPCAARPRYLFGKQVGFTEADILAYRDIGEIAGMASWCDRHGYDLTCFEIALNRYKRFMGES